MHPSLRKIIFKKILNHQPDSNGQATWIKTALEENDRNLSIIYKKTTQANTLGVVVLCHPYRQEAKDFFIQSGHADLYLDLGYHVVLFDFNGYGESPVSDYQFDLDILTVVKYAQRIFPIHKINAHGISFGAAQLLRAIAHTDHHIDKAVIENSMTKYYYYFKKRNTAVYILIRLLTPFFQKMNKDNNYLTKVDRIKHIQHVLFIYGKKDELTTLEMGKQLQVACNVNSELVVYDCTHMKAIETDYEDYKAVLADYSA